MQSLFAKWKYITRTQESKLVSAVNYLPFIGSTHNAVRQNEEPYNKPPKQQERAYLGLSTNLTKIIL